MNLVYENDGWILQRLGDAIKARMGASQGYPVASETNVYLPYYLMEGGTRNDVCLFTHREEAPELSFKAARFDRAARYADRCWAMSRQTYDHLPENKTFLLEIPADPQFSLGRPLRIGISGHAQPGNRKAFERSLIPAEYGCEVLVSNGRIDWEDMPNWYKNLDYLLVTGKVEGGPLPVKEALACGTPVIAPNVGWCWDHPVIRYSNDNELREIFRALTAKDEWEEFFTTLEYYLK